jgi:antitoxin VapB
VVAVEQEEVSRCFFLEPSMALNIKDSETDALVRELAALTGEPMTDAVKVAVKERLERETRARRADWAERLARIRAIQDEIAALPVVDPTFDEHSLYDENGLPA